MAVSPKNEHPTRAGYVTLVGRPNAGKSTLLNTLIEEPLSIVTPKAQTTWERVTAILTVDDAQLILLDTPGLLVARDLHQRSMLASARTALGEADVVLGLVDATEDVDRAIGTLVTELEAAEVSSTTPRHLALTKVDRVAAEEAEAKAEAVRTGPHTTRFDEVHLISAPERSGIDALVSALSRALPSSPFLFPPDHMAVQPVRFFAAELIRACVFEQFEEEVPYSVACRIEEFREGEDPVYIAATVLVERASQKAIVIGKGGAAIRTLGVAARERIERLLDRSVYLDLWVKVLPRWRQHRGHLARLGYPVPDPE